MNTKKFNPLTFLASLGAGGIAIMPYVIMQYTVKHGAGLITRSQLWGNNFIGLQKLYYFFLEGVMITFALIHIALTIWFVIDLIKWLKNRGYKEIINDPLKNAVIVAPLISFLMTMNLFIGPIRYFFSILSNNFQKLFLPAMIVWVILFLISMFLEIYLLSVAFKSNFDINKISFGWLLHPFLLGMLTTVGTGIAAMSQDKSIAELAAFMSMISGSMGLFLLIVKLITIFKSHFTAPGLPEKNFLPSILIVIPNITLYAISAFRFGHFLERNHSFHLDWYFYVVIGFAFAFEIWYLIFGLFLLKDYLKNNHFKEFYITQWGLICPLVAFVVLGGFVHNVVIASSVLYSVLVIVMIATIVLYFELMFKHIKCLRSDTKLICE